MERRGDSRLAGLLLGGLLVVAGIALLAVQLLGYEIRLDLIGLGWPVFVIAPGVILLVIGLIVDREPGIGLSIAGGIVTTVGLILAYQWTTDHWSSWAYAWSLIAPTSIGAAMVLWGLLHFRRSVIRDGLGALGVGLIMFLLFFAFFEGLLGIGGERGLAPLGRSALPLALILAGVLVIVGRVWPRRARRAGGAPPLGHERSARSDSAGEEPRASS